LDLGREKKGGKSGKGWGSRGGKGGQGKGDVNFKDNFTIHDI